MFLRRNILTAECTHGEKPSPQFPPAKIPTPRTLVTSKELGEATEKCKWTLFKAMHKSDRTGDI